MVVVRVCFAWTMKWMWMKLITVPHPGNQWTWPNWQRCRTLENTLSGLDLSLKYDEASLRETSFGFFWLLKEVSYWVFLQFFEAGHRACGVWLVGMPRNIGFVDCTLRFCIGLDWGFWSREGREEVSSALIWFSTLGQIEPFWKPPSRILCHNELGISKTLTCVRPRKDFA